MDDDTATASVYSHAVAEGGSDGDAALRDHRLRVHGLDSLGGTGDGDGVVVREREVVRVDVVYEGPDTVVTGTVGILVLVGHGTRTVRSDHSDAVGDEHRNDVAATYIMYGGSTWVEGIHGASHRAVAVGRDLSDDHRQFDAVGESP